jgi:hypothetical protein
MSQRYFRAEPEVSEQIRLTLDAAWGLPANGQISCFAPAESSPRDSQGRVLLAVREAFCEYAEVAAMLPGLLAISAVEEIDEATYFEPAAPPE